MPKMANAMCMALPTPAALIASGPSGPTITVSTTPIVIHPSSARTTGIAILSIGRNSERMDADLGRGGACALAWRNVSCPGRHPARIGFHDGAVERHALHDELRAALHAA